MYSRPGKITCILKESSIQSMKTKSRGVMPPQNIWSNFNNAWKVSKYGVFSGPFFPAFGLNTERYKVRYMQCKACPIPWYEFKTFLLPTSLFIQVSQIKKLWQGSKYIFLRPPVLPQKLFAVLFTCSQAKLVV